MQHQSNHSSTIQANPVPIWCQSNANLVPIWFQSIIYLMSIHPQSDVDRVPTDPNLVPNHWNANPQNMGVVNLSAIQCQFSTNPFPIPQLDLQSFTNRAFAHHLLDHSSVTAKSQKSIGTHWHRSRQSQQKTIPYLTWEQAYYADRPLFSTEDDFMPGTLPGTPIHDANPKPIHCQSNLSVHCKSINQMPNLYQFHHQSSSNLQTLCQSHENLPI